jgi:hypothetical protein
MKSTSGEVVCPTCKGTVAMRINRSGFLQEKVLSFFGIYPWKCGACGVAFLYRKRGQRPRTHGQDSGGTGHGPKQRHAVKP